MTPQLAKEITKKAEKILKNKYAIVDNFGNILASSKSFKKEKLTLDIKSKKAHTINHKNKNYGYIFFDEPLKTVKIIGPIISSISKQMIKEEYYKKILKNNDSALDQLAYELFILGDGNIKQSKEILEVLGVNYNTKMTSLLVEISDPKYLKPRSKKPEEKMEAISRTKKNIISAVNSFFTQNKNNLVFYAGGNLFFILKSMGRGPKKYEIEFKKNLKAFHRNLKSELLTEISIGVGSYKDNIGKIKESFYESRMALFLGKKTGINKTHHIEDFKHIATIINKKGGSLNSNKKALSEIRESKELYETLINYFESNMVLGKTAKNLKIHRNTLILRLEKITRIGGLDPRRFPEAFQLYMTIMLEKYHESKKT